MKISPVSIGFILLAAMGVAATPLNHAESVGVRSENNVQVKYDGQCRKSENQCRYTAQSGRTAICKCQFRKCSKDGAKCNFDSYNRDCNCY
ncbi:antimicrobial peptide [Aspergillus japonicus CBS 114.51]|uniref:Antimicrobial peptide n=2 Tax=Aspergillus TaxID=5052 RepID=A0A2V5H6U3_ASPV1|nr:antimicrobial peptide [Aspergillus japonicus CBS 114.51]PYI17384.1 antimicrobial peptide [Aspergillus violaceofuscus CBS 115571]RAH80412.1 antimicrobial peptide [Aspergillus japonicus CBS 114.51]